MIIFKRKKFRSEFENLDTRLIHIAFSLSAVMEYEFGKDLVITSVFRSETNSTHKHYRAFDFRISQKFSTHFNEEEINFMKAYCSHYLYGGNKPTLYVHQNRLGGGKHGHVQVNSSDTLILTKGRE